ncbi:hypothetical protein [Dokdonia sp. PRO95]|uniref:DUF3244 domain-containing protein n=1 Tax=Dokdonia sp. PRO95 TaxID=1239415 RepID=UPI0005558967|nr:hypothetical protein [Dokdonia sp. PRO95]
MKQTLKFSAIAFLLFTAITTFAATSEMTHYEGQPELLTRASNPGDKIKKTSKAIDKDVFTEGTDIVYVSFSNPELQTIKLEVRDGLNRIVYSNEIDGEASLNKTFNFKGAYKGYYTIHVENEKESYSKEFEIL